MYVFVYLHLADDWEALNESYLASCFILNNLFIIEY